MNSYLLAVVTIFSLFAMRASGNKVSSRSRVFSLEKNLRNAISEKRVPSPRFHPNSQESLKITVKPCLDNATLEISAIELVPDPLKGGSPFALNITASSKASVADVVAKFNVTAEGFGLVYSGTAAICDYVSCPIPEGISHYSFSGSQIPHVPFSITIKFDVIFEDADENVISCFEFETPIVKDSDIGSKMHLYEKFTLRQM